MVVPVSPRIRVLYAVMKRLVDSNMPLLTEMPALKLRWARNRYSTREERPCLALAFVSDEPRQRDESSTNPDEIVRELGIDFIVDLAIETEASAEANNVIASAAGSFDPSGLQALSMVLDTALKALREATDDPLRDTTDLGKMVDWIEEITIDDDEELPDDDGRLVGRLNVVYRTHSRNPLLLLMRE